MKLTKIQCLEYWQPKFIFSIAREIGTPLALDDCTMNKCRGLFVRDLVDIYMLSTLPNKILVERSNFAFIVDIEYEKLLPFCSSCKMRGHDLSKCMRQPKTNYNTCKILFTKLIVVQYKHVVTQFKEASISNS